MKEKPIRGPWSRRAWKAIAITFTALFCVLAALNLYVLSPYLRELVARWQQQGQTGQADILSGSWRQINQEIKKPEGWRQIVGDSPFTLGGLRKVYDSQGGAHFVYDDAAYPTIDGSTVMVAMAAEFAWQHLGLSQADTARFVQFNTTDHAYGRLFTWGEADYPLLDPRFDAYSRVQSPRPLDLYLGTAPGPEGWAQAEMNGIVPVMKPVCRDAFVFITHKDNPVNSLTLEQARGIFAGEITNWKQVGGENQKIKAYQREPGSGSQTGMEDLVMRGTPMADPETVKVAMGMGTLVDAVAEYRNSEASIGYTYRYYIDNLYRNKNIKTIAIEGIAPTDKNIAIERYPLSVKYYGVIRAGDERQPGGLFLDWILSEEGQACVKQAGYLPVGSVKEAVEGVPEKRYQPEEAIEPQTGYYYNNNFDVLLPGTTQVEFSGTTRPYAELAGTLVRFVKTARPSSTKASSCAATAPAACGTTAKSASRSTPTTFRAGF